MISKSLSDMDFLKIFDETEQEAFYGCVQEWYLTEWQRRAGCGPTVASNLILYLNHTHPTLGLKRMLGSKENALAFMEEIWAFVTPGRHGIPTTTMLYEAVLAYAQANGLPIAHHACDVPEDISMRPSFANVVDFLQAALAQDTPIAFLNLCNGDEKNLDEWHWVTIISMNYAEDGTSAFVNVLDGGVSKPVDLALWYQTTELGGGFVYFTASADLTDNG